VSDPHRDPLLLLDTHTLIWSMEDSPRLGQHAKRAINQAASENRVAVSAITPWEVALLVSKHRVTLASEVLNWLHIALGKPGIHLVGLEPEIAVAGTRLPFEMHPDPADRILVATARHLGATLVTADRALLEIALQGNFAAMDASA
jgi:PIN domain nuclease of toxin-antitoxin system